MERKSTSTPTFKSAAFLAATLGLAGCGDGGLLSLGSGLTGPELSPSVVSQEVSVAGGFRVRAPSGYCIDQGISNRGVNSRVVTLASCANLGGAETSGPFGAPALLSVAPARSSLPDFDVLETFYRGDQGRAELAASGRARDAEVTRVVRSRVGLYINVRDKSLEANGLAASRWVGLVNVAGRSATLSVSSARNAPLSTSAGEALVRDLAQSLINANSGAARARLLR